MILVRQNDDLYEVTFSYDPGIIYHVKNVPGRKWIPEKKMWTVPKDRLGFLINEFKGTVYEKYVQIQSEEDLNINASLDPTTTIPDIDLSKIPFYVKEGAKPYQHQLDFMKWAIDRQQKGNMSGFILADQPGLGKTVETMNLAIYNRKQYKFKHCLVICCVNSSKYNWKEDITIHSQGKEIPYILGTRLRKNGSERSDTGSYEKFEDLKSGYKYSNIKSEKLPYFLIVNIETFRYKEGKKHLFTELVTDLIKKGQINMILIDEVHKNCSPSSKQGQQLIRLKKNTGRSAMWIPMTGTPITSKPTDVFFPLKTVDGHSFGSYYTWCQEFCVYGGFGGYDVVGYKNVPKLKTMLQGNMLRRLKEDVLDLPPKILYTEYVENTDYQKKLYNQVLQEILNDKTLILDSLNPMTKLLRLRQVNGSPELIDTSLDVKSKEYLSKNAKLARLLELLEDISVRGEKVVIFSNWVEPLRTLYRFVSKKYKTCVFTGTMSLEDREKHKAAFMNNPEYTVLLGTIGAAGTSQTFTSARNAIFYDSPWNPSDKEQAGDRIYRIGTKQSVNIFTLVTKDTVDERVENILNRKDGTAKYIVDNKLDLRKNPELFDYLMGVE